MCTAGHRAINPTMKDNFDRHTRVLSASLSCLSTCLTAVPDGKLSYKCADSKQTVAMKEQIREMVASMMGLLLPYKMWDAHEQRVETKR